MCAAASPLRDRRRGGLILIDEARTPLIISGQGSEPTEKYCTYARLIKNLVAEEDYTSDEKTKSATLTDDGVVKIEKWTGIANVYEMENAIETHEINQKAPPAAVHYPARPPSTSCATVRRW